MVEVDSKGTATVHSNARPLPLRRRSQAGAYVRLCLFIGMVLCGLFYVIGAHAQADAAQVEQVRQSCTAKADDVDTAMFNPCATLDTTQVQDRRVSEDTCRALADLMWATQQYTASDEVVACFGAEDDPRVGLALDYGMTEAEAEQLDIQQH